MQERQSLFFFSPAVQQFLLFLLIGCLNTLFGYALFCFFIFVHLHYSVAALLTTVLGVVFNFKTTGSVVFKNKNNYLFMRFLLVYAMLYFIHVFLIKGIHIFIENLYLCGGMAVILTAPLGFTFNKFFVFRYHPSTQLMMRPK